MYAPTQGPVNTGFAQTVIEAKATGSAIKRGQLVSIGFNADGAPSATLSTANDNISPTPVGVAYEDINQGYNGSVVVAGVADVAVNSADNNAAVAPTEAGPGVFMIVSATAGYVTPRLADGVGVAPVGVTTEAKPTTNTFVPMSFSAFSRTQASTILTGNSSETVARHQANTLVPEPGIANRITLADAWEPSSSSFVTTYKESFYQVNGGSNPTGDVLIIDTNTRNGIRSLYSYGGYAITNTGALRSLPFDSTGGLSGFAVSSTGAVTYHRASSIDDADDGYFVWIAYSERAS